MKSHPSSNATPHKIARPSTFPTVNTARNRPGRAPGQRRYALRVMRLAREAMGVPRPPMSTPISSSRQLSVKPESSTAAGTLLMIWLVRTEVARVLAESRLCRASRTASTGPGFR